MKLKFKGTIGGLQDKLSSIEGMWDLSVPNKPVFGTDDGALLIWYPSTGTLQFQGKPYAIDGLKESVNRLLVNDPINDTDINIESTITIGLVHSIINISKALKSRLITIENEHVIEALNDLQNDEDVNYVLGRAKIMI